MPRSLRLAAAQMGTTNRTDNKTDTVNRMLRLLRTAADRNAQVVLFPELAFTTFFARYLINDEDELASWFENGDITTNPITAPIFDLAHQLSIDICVGFAEQTDSGDRFNSCVYYHARSGSVLSKYRKIHLPGDFEPYADPEATHELEKRYFKVGDLGFEAFRVPNLDSATTDTHGEPIFGMMICNDRRWSEAWRVLALQGVDVVLCGYNTAGYAPDLWGGDKDQDPAEAEAIATFQHKLCMQSHSYTSACFSVCAARAGNDDGKYSMIGGSCIVDPEGMIVAETKTLGDEVIVADCDLDACVPGKTRTFDFARHRRVEHYGRIASQTGVIEPPRLSQPASLSNGHKAVVKGNGAGVHVKSPSFSMSSQVKVSA